MIFGEQLQSIVGIPAIHVRITALEADQLPLKGHRPWINTLVYEELKQLWLCISLFPVQCFVRFKCLGDGSKFIGSWTSVPLIKMWYSH